MNVATTHDRMGKLPMVAGVILALSIAVVVKLMTDALASRPSQYGHATAETNHKAVWSLVIIGIFFIVCLLFLIYCVIHAVRQAHADERSWFDKFLPMIARMLIWAVVWAIPMLTIALTIKGVARLTETYNHPG